MPRAKKSESMEKPVWLKYTEEEVKAIILKLANKGLTSEKIGLVLRDQYGIPKSGIFNIKIRKVLQEKGKFQNPDILNLNEKLRRIEAHYSKNKQDKKSHRALAITQAKLKKRTDYHNLK
jgi:small subunit ribosomal protein S15